jgi:hypothetical protein
MSTNVGGLTYHEGLLAYLNALIAIKNVERDFVEHMSSSTSANYSTFSNACTLLDGDFLIAFSKYLVDKYNACFKIEYRAFDSQPIAMPSCPCVLGAQGDDIVVGAGHDHSRVSLDRFVIENSGYGPNNMAKNTRSDNSIAAAVPSHNLYPHVVEEIRSGQVTHWSYATDNPAPALLLRFLLRFIGAYSIRRIFDDFLYEAGQACVEVMRVQQRGKDIDIRSIPIEELAERHIITDIINNAPSVHESAYYFLLCNLSANITESANALDQIEKQMSSVRVPPLK